MEESFIHQNRIRQVFFLVILVVLGFFLARELAAFLPALLGSITLYILLRRTLIWMVVQKKWSKSLAAVILILLSFIVLLIPIGGLISMLTSKVSYAIGHSNELIESVKRVVSDIELRIGIEILSPETINRLGNVIAESLPKVIGATFGTFGTLFFMFFILYFMLVNKDEMEAWLFEYVPLRDENVTKLGTQMQGMVFSNAIGIPVIAFIQGVVGLIGYLIIGVENPWFWFVITCIAGMLPVVGAALAYVPLSIIFFANDQVWQGIAVLAFGFGIIGLVDNVFRFMLARKIGNVHPLITVFGVIIGLTLFGFIGLIFGPILISLFILLVKIYSSEFISKQREFKKHTLQG